MSYTPELGQAVFGAPYAEFECPEYVDAFVDYILWRIGICYWNREQKEWDRYSDPGIPGVEVRGYYWGDDEKEEAKPNMKLDGSEAEIRWYKHPGRGQTVNVEWAEHQWVEWFDNVMDRVREADKVALANVI
jgi:hypothetical protein